MSELRKERIEAPEFLVEVSEFVEAWRYILGRQPTPYAAIIAREAILDTDHRWHISITGQTAVPPWSVLTVIAHDLRPGVPFVIGLPPKSWWINVHENCLHLYETKDENLIEQWRFERRGDTPTAGGPSGA